MDNHNSISGLNATPRGERLHISIFGRRNVGKSSLINALTNQDVAITSNIPGTTTDPVYKTMEILPIGPVVLTDTAGLDDEGELGIERVRRTLGVLAKTDLALLVVDREWGSWEEELLAAVTKRSLPVIIVINKEDELTTQLVEGEKTIREKIEQRLEGSLITLVGVSAKKGLGIVELMNVIILEAAHGGVEQTILGDLVTRGDVVILVTPIDLAAPKGRLILPQVQAIRDLLDHGAQALVIQETELKLALEGLTKPPRMVITDSQAFKVVNELTPSEICLTSFSILFARYKGNLPLLVAGAKDIERLKIGDKVLIAEGCSHHRTDDDIGRVKIPNWLEQRVGGKLQYTWSSGGSLPEDLEEFRLIVHCGSCMLNRRQMLSRLDLIGASGVPVVNYGVAIAYFHGILERVLSPFPEALEVLKH